MKIDRDKTLHVIKTEGWRYDILSKNNPRDNGKLVISCSHDRWAYGRDCMQIEFPLISVWCDPVSPNLICKAHAYIPTKPQSEEEETALEFATLCKEQFGIKATSGINDLILTADEYLKTLRYGISSGNSERNYSCRVPEGFGTTTVPLFDNKAKALAALLDALNKFSTAKVSGIDIVNLNAASDSLLESLGFIKAPDQLGNGVPMWMGDPVKTLTSKSQQSMSSYGYRGQQYISAQKEIVDQFLELLESELAETVKS